MPVFTFSGKDASGQKVSGERVAPNKQSLAQALRRDRITPGAIREKGKEFSMPTFGTTKVKTKDIAIFFRQFSVMIEAGETGGILDIILQRLATYVEKAVRLRSAVKSALIYPVAVVSMAVLIVGALLKWVVPIFANLFAGLGVALPLPTRIVMGLSSFVQTFWWMFFVGAFAIFFGIKQVRKHPTGRYYFDKMLLYVPVIGLLLRKIA